MLCSDKSVTYETLLDEEERAAASAQREGKVVISMRLVQQR